MLMQPHLDRPAQAYQAFLGGCRQHWSTTVLQAVTREARSIAAHGATTEEVLEAELAASPIHSVYAWLERHLQRLKYSGRWGLAAIDDDVRRALHAALAEPAAADLLVLDPSLRRPDYYAAWDIHQHPGGLLDDPLAGAIYEAAAGQGAGVVARQGLHDRFTALVRERTDPRTLIDLGCGFGKSTTPFARLGEGRQVSGIDLSAPCLRLAAHRAMREQCRGITFRQGDARSTGLPGSSCDLVTSTMLLHEMPPEAIADTLREAFRLLQPGGLSIHLDFMPSRDPLDRVLYRGHGRRNNEPFMWPMAGMDFAALQAAIGFADIEILPFEDEDGALARPPGRKWRLPWAVFVARKPMHSA